MLQKLLRKRSDVEKNGIELWLFGSVLHSDNPQDIDLVLIYDKKVIPVDGALELRKHVRRICERTFNIGIDVTLLNVSEANETGFIKMTNAIKVL
jgi:hypothetical protein